MNGFSLSSCLFLLPLAALSACADPEVSFDPDEPPLTPAGLGDRPPPSGANGLLPSCFWSPGAQQALRALATAPLAAGYGQIPNVPLALIPEACRDVLRDTVECALPDGQTLTDPVTSEVYTGHWGLAPGWTTTPLATEGRRYVTGCLLQRLNASGDEVPLLLEGPTPPLQRDPDLAPLYPVLESTAFGDLFSSTTPLDGLFPAFPAFVCWESLLPQSCGLLSLPLLSDRICDDAVLCGLIPLGPCALACVPNGPYWKCRPNLLAPAWPQTVRARLESCP